MKLKTIPPLKGKANNTPMLKSIQEAHLPNDKAFTSRTLTIAPGETKQVAIGSYGFSEPQPIFEISSSPDISEQLGASFEKLDIPGKPKYVAFYHLHNYSDKQSKVTVLRVSAN